MDVEPCSGAQLVELEEDEVVLGPQENVHLANNVVHLLRLPCMLWWVIHLLGP